MLRDLTQRCTLSLVCRHVRVATDFQARLQTTSKEWEFPLLSWESAGVEHDEHPTGACVRD
jgi:hypothetical protein